MPWDPTTFAPDPNLVGSGPWSMAEYVTGSHVLLVANKPSRTVDTGLDDPNAESVPIHSPYGYFKLKPKYIDIHADNYRAKILCKESVPACNPQKWMLVNLTATDHNLWMEEFEFEFAPPVEAPPIGKIITLMWPEPLGCIWEVVDWIDGNAPEYPPNGVLSVCDLIKIVPVAPAGPPGAYIWVHIEKPAEHIPFGWHVGQVIEAEKYIYVDSFKTVQLTLQNTTTVDPPLNSQWHEIDPVFSQTWKMTAVGSLQVGASVTIQHLASGVTMTFTITFKGTFGTTITIKGDAKLERHPIATAVHEYEKPCIPIVETFTVNLTKCNYTVTLAKKLLTEWFLCPNNNLVPYPYDPWINVTWPIWVTIKEDITGSYYLCTQCIAPDCKVDLKDVFAAGKAFGSVPGDAKWNTVADINGDYKIDLKDYFVICKKFGKW